MFTGLLIPIIYLVLAMTGCLQLSLKTNSCLSYPVNLVVSTVIGTETWLDDLTSESDKDRKLYGYIVDRGV